MLISQFPDQYTAQVCNKDVKSGEMVRGIPSRRAKGKSKPDRSECSQSDAKAATRQDVLGHQSGP